MAKFKIDLKELSLEQLQALNELVVNNRRETPIVTVRGVTGQLKTYEHFDYDFDQGVTAIALMANLNIQGKGKDWHTLETETPVRARKLARFLQKEGYPIRELPNR